MDNQPEQRPLGEQVLATIKEGNVKMRSRWYFRLRDILAVMAIVIILLMAVFLASFVIFVLHQDGAWFVPVFGLAGWYALFNALPWVLILLSLGFVVVLAILARRYQFGYQWPLLYSVFAVIFLVTAVCFVFVQTSLYGLFFASSVPQDIPFIGSYYPGIGVLGPENIHRGEIVIATADGFVLLDSSGRVLTVLVGPDTNIPFGASPQAVFRPGELVVVFGDISGTSTVKAIGVQQLQQ